MGNKFIKISSTVYVILTTLCLGCTRNDGNIGNWFGTWQVTGIEINGTMESEYSGNVVLMFQNEVMESQSQYDHHVVNRCFAKWEERDGTMYFEIPETTDEDTQYGYVEELHLPWVPLIEMKIVNLSGKKAELSYTSSSGETIRYFLKKIY